MTTKERTGDHTALPIPGLEPDNLLAFLALVGLLRSLETSRPGWNPHAFWKGPPWVAQLVLSEPVDQAQVASAANRGVALVAAHFDPDNGRRNVDFVPAEYREYALRTRMNPLSAALAAALTSECPSSDDRLRASPLVMMFGQGHQCFLERLIAIANDEISYQKLSEALFSPWRRDDDADGFRWDPEDDQRYALRYGNPSKAGAAPTVVGANLLAAIGFLSFASVPRERRLESVGAVYDRDRSNFDFVWPIWTVPLSRACIEALLDHPDVLQGRLFKVRALGIAEIYRAQRIANGKYMNVARAKPVSV